MYRLLSPVIFDCFSPFYIPDSGSGSGGGNNENEDDEEEDLDDPPAPSATGNAATDNLIRDYFDRNRAWVKKQRRVLGRNRTRAVNAERALETERAANRDKPTITAADLTAYEAYKALGSPDEVQKKIKDGETAASESSTLKRDTVLREAAEIAGYNVDVLRDRAGTLDVLTREVDESGTKVKRAYVKSENGQEVVLTDYATQHWAVYLPALTANPTTNGNTESQTQTQQQFPGQGSARNSSTAPTTNKAAVAAYTRNTYAGPPKRGG